MNQSIQKKTPPKQINTIDEKHTELLNLFHENETETIPRLIAEKERLKAIIPTLQDHQIDTYMEIRDKILEIKFKIKELKQEKKKYLLDNSKYIFNYFEEKKKISSGDNNQNVKILNSFFKIKGKTDETSDINSEKYSQSKKIFQNYWRNVNNEVIHIQDYIIPSDICEECRKGELIPQEDEGILICNNNECGKYITYIIDSSKPTNKEPPNEVSYTAYIRLNHFKEILSQFQAKETTQIPME